MLRHHQPANFHDTVLHLRGGACVDVLQPRRIPAQAFQGKKLLQDALLARWLPVKDHLQKHQSERIVLLKKTGRAFIASSEQHHAHPIPS